jgi:hypothetical protein
LSWGRNFKNGAKLQKIIHYPLSIIHFFVSLQPNVILKTLNMTRKRLQPLLSIAAIAMLALGMTACGNKTGEGSSTGDSLSVGVTQTPSDSQHSAEFITLRIDTIYRLRNNESCCSQRYLELYNQARQLSEEDGTLFIDYDHWAAGQDVDEEWSYELMSVSNVTDSTAQATMNIHNYTDQRVVLDLVFERGTWFVDNFHIFFEGSDYDSDGNSIPDSEGVKETDEVKEMQSYVQQVADREGQKADATIDIPRGQGNVDAAIKAARKRVDAATGN